MKSVSLRHLLYVDQAEHYCGKHNKDTTWDDSTPHPTSSTPNRPLCNWSWPKSIMLNTFLLHPLLSKPSCPTPSVEQLSSHSPPSSAKQLRPRPSFTPKDELVMVREVAAVKAHIAPFHEMLKWFAVATTNTDKNLNHWSYPCECYVITDTSLADHIFALLKALSWKQGLRYQYSASWMRWVDTAFTSFYRTGRSL